MTWTLGIPKPSSQEDADQMELAIMYWAVVYIGMAATHTHSLDYDRLYRIYRNLTTAHEQQQKEATE